MRSVQALTYGKVEARARFARGSAVVSSLVTIKIWASSSEGWAGEVDATTGHASAAFDWLRVYTWRN